jgi:polysaccharide deacetylase family protein (PEP-CTERM system associated)
VTTLVPDTRSAPSDQQTRRPTTHILTFDAEHWYEGYRHRGFGGWDRFPPRDPATVNRLLRLLAEHRQQATFFVTGRFAAEFSNTVRAIGDAGHEIASHGFEHFRVERLGSRAAFRDDLCRSLDTLRSLTDHPIRAYRAPFWAIGGGAYPWMLQTLHDEGLEVSSSRSIWGLPLGARARAPLGPHRVPLDDGDTIWEIPPTVLRLGPCRVPTAGGFYLRFLPESLIWAALDRAAARSEPGVIYLHPYDMDPDAPRLPAAWYFHLMRYHRLERTEPILRRLLGRYRFTSMTSWLDAYGGHAPDGGVSAHARRPLS